MIEQPLRTTEIVFTWPDGREEVRYRRAYNSEEALQLIADCCDLQAKHGAGCPYSFRHTGPAMITGPATNTGPTINRHRSKQDYATPADFILAVERRFGKIEFDLAASSANAKAEKFFSAADNSLVQEWPVGPLLWLNPPFNNIKPWAEKCLDEAKRGCRILFLTPASVGSNWFAEFIAGDAFVLFLRPRLSFDGKNPFPRDCILSVFDSLACQVGYRCWNWKEHL